MILSYLKMKTENICYKAQSFKVLRVMALWLPTTIHSMQILLTSFVPIKIRRKKNVMLKIWVRTLAFGSHIAKIPKRELASKLKNATSSTCYSHTSMSMSRHGW